MATASHNTTTVGIAGLTGKFARLVASSLLEKPNARIRGYVRDPTKLDSSLALNPRVEVIQGEAYDAAKARTFVQGCDVVICAYLGDDKLMVEGQKILVDACEAEKVPRYIASDYCLDFTKLEKGQLFPKDPMIEVKEYLDQQQIVKGVHVLIGGFMDTIFSPYFQIWDSESKALKIWGGEDLVWEITSYKTAAQYVAAVAMDSEAVGVKKFLGDRKSNRQIADAIRSVRGVQAQVETLGTLDSLYKRMHELKQQYPENPFKYMAMFYQYYCVNGQCYLGDLDNGRYPEVRPESLEDFLRRATETTL
ncbi:hypothetical protein BFW01_g8933 [Lasiodiplodia theobromae]|nr:hypothetical protein BFW01_g8933 [Lasiodiplodia theobromae]